MNLFLTYMKYFIRILTNGVRDVDVKPTLADDEIVNDEDDIDALELFLRAVVVVTDNATTNF